MSRKASFTFFAIAIAISIALAPGNSVTAQDNDELDAAIVGPTEFVPGTETALQIVIQNNNPVDAFGVTARLKEGDTPILVKTDKAALGTITAGMATPPVPFLIEVREDAQPSSYPMDLEITRYEEVGEVPTTWIRRTQTIQMTVAVKLEEHPLKFEVADVEATVSPGVQKDIEITFRNSSLKTANDALVKLRATPPISLIENTAFIGTLAPEQSAVGKFRLKVDGNAIPKEHALDAEIKYTDNEGNDYVSEVIKVPIEVAPGAFRPEVTQAHVVGGLVGAGIMAVIWIIWWVWFRVKPIVSD